jgi:hypothetical protein
MWKTMKQICNLIMQPQELERTITKKMTLHKWKQKQLLQKWRWLIKKCEKSKKPKIITTYGSKNQRTSHKDWNNKNTQIWEQSVRQPKIK